MAEPYEESSNRDWRDKFLAFTWAPGISAGDFVGKCPRCDHSIAVPVDTTNLESPASGISVYKMIKDTHRVQVLAKCDCTQDHAGRPKDLRGCGARGLLTVEL